MIRRFFRSRGWFWIEGLAVRAVEEIIPALSRPAVLSLGRRLGWLAWLIDVRGRRTAAENLRLVFPEKSAAWRREITRKNYQSFARVMLDLFWVPNLNGGNWRAFNRLVFDDAQAEVLAREHGAIWCTPHFGNFEWIALLMGWRGFPMMVVAQDFKNPALTRIFSRLRGASGHIVISSEGAMLRLFKNLKRGGHSSFLCDLTIKPDQAATIIRCLGRKMCVTVLHAALVQRTGLPVIPMISIPQDDGTYLVRQWPAQFFPPGATAQQIAQDISDLFEPVLREHPEHWLWMYKHWRHLPADPDGIAYPDYANRSKAFDRLESGLANAPDVGSEARPGPKPTLNAAAKTPSR